MFHFLKVMAVVGLTTFLSTALLFAAIGTPGGNGLVPYIDISSTMVDQDITFTIMNVAPDFPTEPYYFLFSTDHYPNGGWCFPEFGPGAVILPNIGAGHGAIQVYNENPISFFIPPEAAGWSYTCQAIIPDTGAKNGLCFSQPLEFTFKGIGITNFDDLHFEIEGCVPHVGHVSDVVVKGEYVYAASKTFGLSVLKQTASQPSEIIVVGTLNDSGTEANEFRYIGTNGEVALISNGAGKCWIVDVSNPSAIKMISDIECTNIKISDIVVSGSSAYVISCVNQKLEVLDLTNPLDVKLRASLDLSKPPMKIEYIDDHILVYQSSGCDGELCVYDFVESNNELLIKDSYPVQSYCVDFCVSSGKLLILDGFNKKLEVFDTAKLPYVSQSKIAEYEQVSGQQIALNDDSIACVYDSSNHSVRIKDLSGQSPVLLKTIDAPWQISRMIATDSFCYFAAGDVSTCSIESGGLQVLDLNSKMLMDDLYFNIEYEANANIEIFSDSLAFVAFKKQGIYSIDISNASSPRLLNRLSLSSKSINVMRYKDYLCYTHDHTLTIASVDSHGVLTTVGELESTYYLYDLETKGNIIYAKSNFPNGLVIIDASNIYEPEYVTTFDKYGTLGSMEIHGENMFCSFMGMSAVCLDLSNPASPIVLSTSDDFCNYAYDIVMVYPYMYGMSYYQDTLFAIDCSNPMDIQFDSSFILVNSGYNGIDAMANTLICSQGYDHINNGGKSIALIDISGKSVTLSNYYSDDSYIGCSYSVAVKGDLIFMANSRSLLSVLKLSDLKY